MCYGTPGDDLLERAEELVARTKAELDAACDRVRRGITRAELLTGASELRELDRQIHHLPSRAEEYEWSRAAYDER